MTASVSIFTRRSLENIRHSIRPALSRSYGHWYYPIADPLGRDNSNSSAPSTRAVSTLQPRKQSSPQKSVSWDLDKYAKDDRINELESQKAALKHKIVELNEKIQKLEKPEEPEGTVKSEKPAEEADTLPDGNVLLIEKLIEVHESSRKELELAVAELQNDNRRLREKNGKLAKAQVLLKEKSQKHEISRKELDMLLAKLQKEKKTLLEENFDYQEGQVLMAELVEEHERSMQEEEFVIASQLEEINMLHREQHVLHGKLRETEESEKRAKDRGNRLAELVENLRADTKNTTEHIRLLERLLDWWKWNGKVVKMKDKRYSLACLAEQHSGDAKIMMTCWNMIPEDGKWL